MSQKHKTDTPHKRAIAVMRELQSAIHAIGRASQAAKTAAQQEAIALIAMEIAKTAKLLNNPCYTFTKITDEQNQYPITITE